MSTRERILTVRLLEKIKDRPAYAQALGIEVKREKLRSQAKANARSAGNTP